mgnify:CR=1 FL=1
MKGEYAESHPGGIDDVREVVRRVLVCAGAEAQDFIQHRQLDAAGYGLVLGVLGKGLVLGQVIVRGKGQVVNGLPGDAGPVLGL